MIEVTKIRSTDVQYKVILCSRGSGRHRRHGGIFQRNASEIARLIEALITEFRFVCEMRFATDECSVAVCVPEDVTIEAIESKAAVILDRWEATLG